MSAKNGLTRSATSIREFQRHPSNRLPVLLPCLYPRRTAVSDYFPSKERNFLDPSDPDFLKRRPTATPEAPKTLPPKGDLAPSSIFDEKPPGEKPDAAEPATSTLSTRDPLVLAAAIDPNPVARQRWQRKMIIRDIRNRGQLTKAQQLKRTERESLCKSPFFKTSIKKLYPLARQIAGKPIEEAIIQMRFSKKRVARDVKKHLEYARDEAIVKRGMGLGMVKPEESEAAENEESGVDTKLKSDHENKANWPGMVVEDKKGKRRFVNDTSSIYVDEAWVGRGTYRGILEYRARGRVNVLKCPETSITVRLKEEATRIRLMDEREQKREKKKVWVALPDRPVTAQRQYCLCFNSSLLSNPPSKTHQPPLSPKPTIILIPGGWQSPTTFSLILPALERFGYSVIPVSLPSTTTVPAVSSFAPDVEAIRNTVTSCLSVGKDVVMIMHSYGGLVGCEALKEMDLEEQEKRKKKAEVENSVKATADGKTLRRGRVLRLGFIAGLVFPVGRSTLSPTFAADKKVKGFTCVDDLISVTDGAKRFFNDLPPEEGELWAGRLRKHSRLFVTPSPANAFTSALTHRAYDDHPSSYLLCTRDNAIPLRQQQQMVAAAGITDLIVVESGHCPQVSRPGDVVRWVRKVAGERGLEKGKL
ncbi:MAG: hypothetical protein Q9228_004114 [Teloschistes exilis]